MSNTKLGLQIPLTIEIITPLHIGGNAVLSPLADYWMDGQKNIQLINEDALAEAVYSTGKTKEYVKSVQDVATERKGKMLEQFAKHDLKKDIKDFFAGNSIKAMVSVTRLK